MSTLQKISDALPGGESRAAGRAEIERAKMGSKEAKANAKSTKETYRPISTKVKGFVALSLAVGTVFYLSKNNGGEAIGEAASQSAKTGINVVAGVGSVGVDVASGVVSGTKEGVDEITQDSDITFDNPLSQDDDRTVSNTVPANPGSNGETSSAGVAGDLVILTNSVEITEVPVGEDGARDYSASGVVATPIQVAKLCFSAGEVDMTSTGWADLYDNNILTVESNFVEGGAFYQEQQPTLNPGDIVNCQ